MATLAIDAGTTLIKAVVVSDTGAELAVASRNTTVISPQPGWSEQDMHQVWSSVEEACIEALQASSEAVSVIAVTGQGDGAWIIDADGRPLRPAILWNDGRAAEEILAFEKEGKGEHAWALNGSLTSLGLPNAIMMWLAKNEPETLSSADAVLTCGGWITYRLTGVAAQDISEASAPWINVRTGTLSSELLTLYGLEDYAHLIPPVLTSPQLPLLETVAASWGVASNTPVVVAPYDIVATATGSGSVHPGDAFAILGTTICPGVLVEHPQLDGAHTGLNILGVGDGLILRAFPTVTGANTLTWLAHMVGVESVETLLSLAETAPPGANGVMWLPYLSDAGERAPFFDPDASGLLYGLTHHHTPADIARGLLESLSFIIKESLIASGAAPTRLTLSGGGARSALWCQIIADVTGVSTTRTQDSQVGAKGAHVYASVATGQFDTFAAAVEALVFPGDTFTPHTEHRNLHDERFALFHDLRAAVSPLWKRKRHHRGS